NRYDRSRKTCIASIVFGSNPDPIWVVGYLSELTGFNLFGNRNPPVLGTFMSAPPGLDRESFQTLLANAFVIQESGIDTQLVLALTEVQRLIASDKPDVDQVIHLIAEQARRVSGAAGIAIALLKEGQLVYLVGIGSAATYVGQHMNAVLNTPAHKTARAEIL